MPPDALVHQAWPRDQCPQHRPVGNEHFQSSPTPAVSDSGGGAHTRVLGRADVTRHSRVLHGACAPGLSPVCPSGLPL